MKTIKDRPLWLRLATLRVSEADTKTRLYEAFALLQELVDAPEPEPFGYFKAEPFGWTDCAETDDGAIALFAAPPAPSVPDMPLSMEQFGRLVGLARDDASEKAIVYKATNIYGETCYFGVKSTAQAWAKSGRVDEVRLRELRVVATPPAPSVPELEEYDAGALNDFGGGNVGWWQDYIRAELDRAYEFYCSQLSAAQTPAEPPTDVARDVRLQVESEFAAPQPEPLSDERIDKICDTVERDNVLFSQSGIYALARAIEREILGGLE